MPQRQCDKCPWKVTTDPHDIPGGYCEAQHRALTSTIAEPGAFRFRAFRVMACHESRPGRELPCVGWVHHQIGEGNNLTLRLLVIRGRIRGDYVLDGEQHKCLEDTFPTDD